MSRFTVVLRSHAGQCSEAFEVEAASGREALLEAAAQLEVPQAWGVISINQEEARA